MDAEAFLERLDGVQRQSASQMAERFWPKVKVGGPDECWPWQRRITRTGYGHFYFPRDGRRTLIAHRIAYELACGPIPMGMIVRHRCDNPPCCNPAHLLIGTPKDNTADAMARGRLKWPPPPILRGEANPNSRLTDSQRREIAARRTTGESAENLARAYGVDRRTINRTVAQWT